MRSLFAFVCLMLITASTTAQVTPASEQKYFEIVTVDSKVIHLSVADLAKYKQVGASVTADDGTKVLYTGPLLRDVLLKFGILSSGPI